MKKIEEKAVRFLVALSDVYRDEENRELGIMEAMDFSDDITEDFTAMLLAMKVLVEKVTEYDGDIIDFTHMLNKLAVQYVMGNNGEIENA
jgi:TolB-like protein